MSYDFVAHARDCRGRFLEWRSRYSKDVYPRKVILNLFYNIYPIELIWEDIDACFRSKLGTVPDLNAANLQIGFTFGNAQAGIRPQIERLLRNGLVTMGVDSFAYDPIVERASLGSNRDVEELEFAFTSQQVLQFLFLSWAALGLTGLPREDAFFSVGNAMYPGSLDSLDGAIALMSQLACQNMGGLTDSFGRTIFLGAYQPLPDLW